MMNFDVFISYPHENKAVADAACAKLEAEGIRCWIAPRDIAPSADWASSIVDAIDNCRVMVLIFSAHTNRSKQVGREVQQAFDAEKPVVPFRIENVAPEKSLRYYMGPVHWLDALTPPFEQHLQKLAVSVRALITAKLSEVAGESGRATHDASARQVEEPQTSAKDELRQSEPVAGVPSPTWSIHALWTGRIDRFAYLIGFLLCTAVGLVAAGLVDVAGTITDSNPHLVGSSGLVAVCSVGLSGLLGICVTAAWFVLSIRRLHDIGRAGWWCLLSLVPLINYVLIGYLLLKKGAADTNRYGSPPITKERGIFGRIVNA
jgi:uncharacterized membrane protein YhaH (DUF805 family)